MLARALHGWFAGWMGLLTAGFYLWPSQHMLWWGAIGLSSTAAVVLGVVVHRPRRRWPWVLLAAAVFAFGAGDFAYNVLTDVLHVDNPFPSFADVFYLAMYPLVAGGLLGFIRSRTGRSDRASLIDAATLTIGLALLSWIFLIVPYVRNDELTNAQKLVSVGYPLGDVLILAVFARLLTAGVQRNGAVLALGAGTAGLLAADVVYVKIVNDTLGHGAGDELLVAVGRRIAEQLRTTDTVARLGGDEFAALIEADSMTDLELVAERIVLALAEPFAVAGERVNGNSSIGLATTLEATTGDDLLRQADLALHLAKGAGKDQWRRYQSDLHTAMLQRLEMRSALDQAVKDDQFVLQYQPIVDLLSGRAVGFEALVRWNHPVRGVVGPVSFIELAEESGLIVPIGRTVLQQALRTVSAWQRRLPPGTLRYISVNVSARQVRTPGFVEEVRRALADSGVAPATLLLEITESPLLRNDEQVTHDLEALRIMGVRLAIDDFGTGYSSLSYLQHMPIDVLKIDKSFVDELVAASQQRALVRAIVQLAQTLNLSVVAEGVEHAAQLAALVEIGCPYGQGYHFARPLPEPDAFAFLREPKPLTQPVG